MPALTTIQIPLGYPAPEFELLDTISDKFLTLKELKSEKATVIMFICNHCPYVKHIVQVLINFANEYIPLGISFIAISSNDVKAYPEDHPDLMKKFAAINNFPFPYLYDETQEIAKAYDAACTPDFMITNKYMEVVYRGQFDGSRPGNSIPVTGESLKEVLDLLIKGEKAPTNQIPSVGCSIKWKS